MDFRRVLPLCIVLLVMASAYPVRAAEPLARVPIAYESSMSRPHGVRNIGMGITGTAGIRGYSTGFFNPASFAWADAVTVGGSYQEWILDIVLTDTRVTGGFNPKGADAGNPWRFGGSLAYSTMSLDRDVERVIFLPEGTGTTFELDDYYISGSGAAAWERSFVSAGAGGTAKYLHEQFAGESVSTWAFDIGGIVAFPIPFNGGLFRPRVGWAVTNLSTGISLGTSGERSILGETRGAAGLDFSSAIRSIGGGVWQRDVPVFSVSMDYDYVNFRNDDNRDDSWALGWEVSIIELVQARYGTFGTVGAENQNNSTYGFGVGWSFARWLFQMDYAHLSEDLGFFGERNQDVFGAVIGGRF